MLNFKKCCYYLLFSLIATFFFVTKIATFSKLSFETKIHHAHTRLILNFIHLQCTTTPLAPRSRKINTIKKKFYPQKSIYFLRGSICGRIQKRNKVEHNKAWVKMYHQSCSLKQRTNPTTDR